MDSESIKLSVVIPTFNRKKYLKKTLKSLLKQDLCHDSYEIIVVDDYSTDGTKELVEEISKKSNVKVSYCANNKTKGQLMARNSGFQKAQGEFVASTDDDIELNSDWLSKGLAYFKNSGISAVEGRVITNNATEEPFYHNLSMNGGAYCTANIFYRKSALEKAGWLDKELNVWHNYGSHYVLGLKILENGGKIIYADDLVAYHASYKIKGLSIIKNSLKSTAIPYLYKTYGASITPYLGFRARRILVSSLLLLFIISAIFLNCLAAIVILLIWIIIISKMIPGFFKVKMIVRVKAFFVYSVSYLFATIYFLYGCSYYKIFPTIKMVRR
ncbi:MAG: glycosyltransferase family 2 protein [Candidatus Omnitrophica bacterium]|nr:glycosyltransferase family 2 protein [Candidatus Omnitrophota bacterium]MDD5429306.1 glycosyltransferase family 2 protein [Candidatus Omnitrophota bacterium]